MRSQFRSYFQNIVDMIYKQKNDIEHFVMKGLKQHKNKSLHMKKNYKKHNKTKKLY